MNTVNQTVLITWLQSAKHFWSHDYCRPVLITRILSVRQFWSHDHCQHAVLITWLSAKQFWSHDYCRPGNFYHRTTVRQFWSHEYCICWSGSHVPKTFFFSQEIFRQIIQNYFQSVLNKFNLCPNTHQTLYKLPESLLLSILHNQLSCYKWSFDSMLHQSLRLHFYNLYLHQLM